MCIIYDSNILYACIDQGLQVVVLRAHKPKNVVYTCDKMFNTMFILLVFSHTVLEIINLMKDNWIW